MAKSKVRMVCNLGWMDAVKYGLPGGAKEEELPADGDEILVTEDQEKVLVGLLKCAVPVEEEKRQAKYQPKREQVEEASVK